MDHHDIKKYLPGSEDICAIITVYNPDPSLIGRIKKIKCEVRHIVVVINRCSEYILTNLRETLSISEFHHIIINPHNRGQGYALNQGMEFASFKRLQWALLLDQDTDLDNGAVKNLSDILSEMPELPAIIGLNYRDMRSGKSAVKCRGSNQSWRTKTTIITSGTLLNLEHAKDIGPFKSEYFIDSIDHEYCMRARAHGYEIYITCLPMMTHSIGLQKDTLLNRLQCLLSQPHIPERKYYLARNTAATAKSYLLVFPTWSLRQFLRIPADLLSTLIFESNKKQKFLFTLQGLTDGLRYNFRPGPLEIDGDKH